MQRVDATGQLAERKLAEKYVGVNQALITENSSQHFCLSSMTSSDILLEIIQHNVIKNDQEILMYWLLNRALHLALFGKIERTVKGNSAFIYTLLSIIDHFQFINRQLLVLVSLYHLRCINVVFKLCCKCGGRTPPPHTPPLGKPWVNSQYISFHAIHDGIKLLFTISECNVQSKDNQSSSTKHPFCL